MEKSFDVIIIGGGPGGYVCAIRCAQLGMKTACIEKRENLGGTCLNVGCIPSKSLLYASEKYAECQKSYKDLGINIGKLNLDLKTMLAHKDKVVADNARGVEFLFRKNKIHRIKGEAKLSGKGTVEVGGETYSAKHIVIATGSEVMTLPGINIDENKIVSSTGALSLDKVPGRMAIIGGGYIGLEMASVWSRLGSAVTVMEFQETILPGMDGEVTVEMHKLLQKQGIAFKLSSKVLGAEISRKGVEISVSPATGGDTEKLEADILLVAVGRKPFTQGLELEEAGVELDGRGRIKVDGRYRTNISGIYAIGDVIAGPMLAHKAEDEAVALAELLDGQSGHVDYDLIPSVVYTTPEAAQVGRTEEQLKEQGIDYRSGKFHFSANGRARAMNMTEGFVKILADARTDRVLGVHIIGPEAGTLISEAVTAMEFGASSEDIARICHAHPTLEEAIREAALAVHSRALHS